MSDQELAELLTSESDRVERKPSLADRTDIRKTICAFANDLPDHLKPGVVVVGVKDDGSCAGFPITDEVLRTLADMRSDGNILPMPNLTVQRRTLDGCEVALVLVQPSDAPPVRYKGVVYVRVGSRLGSASAEEERRLGEKRRARDLPFDLHPLPSATIDDLDTIYFERAYLPAAISPEVLEANERTLAQRLASLRFATPGPDFTPTIVGILAVGSDPRRFVPGDYVQFVRYDGTDIMAPIRDQAEIDGPLPDLLRQLDEKLQAHISVATDIVSEPIEVRRPDYPIAALQQLVRNAIMHRNYDGTNAPVRISWFDDRIEIQNPGGPFGQVTRENFGQPGVTDYRNPNLAAVMKDLGYVQKFGLGIRIARQELQRNGSPDLEFEVQDTYILAIVRRRR